MPFCNMCGKQIDSGTTCATCSGGAGVGNAAVPVSARGMPDNVAGMLAYVTIIPAIIFLLLEPYNKSRFVRFHSFQCLFFCVALIIVQVGLSILGVGSFLALITIPLHFVVDIGALVIWIVLLLKANQGLMYKLPIIGDMAEKQANSM